MMKCSEEGCNNKFYGFDKISPFVEFPYCRKHYRMYALGWSEYEATKGKKDKV